MKLYLGTDEGMAAFEGQEESWHPRYLRLQTHKVTAIAASREMLWVGTTHGLWHSSNGGAAWAPLVTGLGECHVRALAVHPHSANTVLVGTEPASIFITRDGGKSWVEAGDVARLRGEKGWSLPYSPAAGCIRGFSLTRDRIYAAAEVGGVLRSDDAGVTWRLMEGDIHPDVHDLAGLHNDPNTIYAATGGGRYRSQNGGVSWDLIGDGYTRAIWIDLERPGVVLAGPARYVGAMGRVERSIDNGDNWMLASDGFDIPMSSMIERFVTAESHVLAVLADGTIHTTKRGVWTWRRLELGLAPVRAAAFSDA
jgi:photosystem II stability/assembly factor-like uncharacterized protein